jgi:hypothetical protein
MQAGKPATLWAAASGSRLRSFPDTALGGPSALPCQAPYLAKRPTLPSALPCQAPYLAKRPTLPSALPYQAPCLIKRLPFLDHDDADDRAWGRITAVVVGDHAQLHGLTGGEARERFFQSVRRACADKVRIHTHHFLLQTRAD